MEYVNRSRIGLISLLVCSALLGPMSAAAELPAKVTEVVETVAPTQEGEPEAATDTVRQTATEAAKKELEKATAAEDGDTAKDGEAATDTVRQTATEAATKELEKVTATEDGEIAKAVETVKDGEITKSAETAKGGENTKDGKSNDEKLTVLCDTKTIDKVFREYEKSAKENDKAAGLEQIKKIQQQLKLDGYEPGDIDGFTGDNTDAALVRLCLDQKVDEFFKDEGYADPEEAKKHLAEHLVELLFKPSIENTEEEEPAELCDIETIDEVFKDYEKAVGRDQIRKIQLQLKVGGYDPGDIDGFTGDNTDAAFAQLCVDAGVDEFFKANEDMDEGEARKRLASHLVDLLLNPTINLTGGDCGCSRDFSALVYGFYPYLQAVGEMQEIDLSLLGRIGYHALVLNKAGEIQNDLQWRSDNGNVADFIHEAHQHRVKVDVTFYMLDWQAWDFSTIDKAAKNIAATVNQEFHGTDLSLWHKILRLVGGTSTVNADGVNLHFAFNDKAGVSKKLSEIVTRVFEKLEDVESDATINVMLGLKPSAIDKQQLAELKGILVGDAAVVDKVFIFQPQNSSDSRKETSNSKKLLRQRIENAFNGENRRTVLRKFIPITTPGEVDFEPLPVNDGRASQFDDDLVYLDDNFAGVGLWPLPLKSGSNAEEISVALINHFRAKDGINYLGEKLEDYAPQVCSFVCPNRIYIYIGLELLAGILVVFALLALFNCRLRETFKRYFILFLVLFLSIPLILVISLICDPAWEKYVDRVVIGILLLFIAGFVWHSVRKAVRPKLP